jgi:HlyD family secretion protein
MANGKSKKTKKKIIIFGGLGVLLIALILVGLFSGSKEEIVAVQTEEAAKRNITQTVAATGKINPEFQVVITPEVTGEIITLPVKEGDRVKKGDLLIKIKADIYIAQQDRAEANLLSAKSSLTMRQAELEKISADFERMKEMHAKKLASDAELEGVRSSFLSAKAGYEGAEANVLQMQAGLKEINEQINKTAIYSPMDGTITQLNVEVAERVLGSGFSQGTNIMTVADLGNMEATVQVDENDVVLVSIGDTARIKVDAFSNKEFSGVVTQIGNSALSQGLGTQEQVVNFNVRIKLIDPDPNLRPGMSCNSDIETETILDVISVPIQSVTARSDIAKKNGEEEKEEEQSALMVKQDNKKANSKPKEIVFIVKDGKAESVEVETGLSDDNYIEIKSGLEGGETIVSGSYRAISRELNDGTTVRVDDKKTFGKK